MSAFSTDRATAASAVLATSDVAFTLQEAGLGACVCVCVHVCVCVRFLFSVLSSLLSFQALTSIDYCASPTPAPQQSHGDSAISGGSVFLIVLVTVGGAYFLGGLTYNYM